MAKPKTIAYTLYRIYYDDVLVYVGRTKQPLQTRIHGHLFKAPMHRELDINQISKIEYSTYETEADMFLYEIYWINLWHPPLNKDDKAKDSLTITLPDVEWRGFETPLWDKWKREIHELDENERRNRQRELDRFRKRTELRKMFAEGKITEEEFSKQFDELEEGIF